MNEPEKQSPDTKHPGGRPSKYTLDMPDRTRAYTRDYNKIYKHQIPTVCGLAGILGVTSRTIENWVKDEDKQEFFRTLGQLMDVQQQVLIDKGLVGEFNSVIDKLILSSNHGYKERTDKTSDDKPIQPTVISFSDAVKPKEGEGDNVGAG